MADTLYYEGIDNNSLFQHRAEIDLLRSRIDLLNGQNKMIMQMVLEYGVPVRQIAILCGLSECTVSRRVKRLFNQLADGEYLKCLRRRNRFSAEEMDMARLYFLEGKSIRRIAAECQSTYYRIHRTISDIRKKLN